jgi:mannosyltransferase OCH1-like enzyme
MLKVVDLDSLLQFVGKPLQESELVLVVLAVAFQERQELEASMVAEAERRPNVLGVIPKKVHQIWMGGAAIPPWRQYLFDLNREAAKRNGYAYRLWTNDDRNRENFPSTIA